MQLRPFTKNKIPTGELSTREMVNMAASKVLGKTALLNFCKKKCTPKTIEALDGDLNIRMLTVAETMEFTEEEEGLSGFDSALLYASYLIGDEHGDRMFTDLDDLRKLPPAAIMEVSEAGNMFNRVSSEGVEEEAKK